MTELIIPELINAGDVQGYCDLTTGECVPAAPAPGGADVQDSADEVGGPPD
jgi:hypothetical protein